jgi:hypothetical protein
VIDGIAGSFKRTFSDDLTSTPHKHDRARIERREIFALDFPR